jgi:ATP-dependent protease Clp ATPase subunit
MLDIMFEIPSRSDIDEVVVTREAVLEGKPPIYVLKRREDQRRRERRVNDDLGESQAREA